MTTYRTERPSYYKISITRDELAILVAHRTATGEAINGAARRLIRELPTQPKIIKERQSYYDPSGAGAAWDDPEPAWPPAASDRPDDDDRDDEADPYNCHACQLWSYAEGCTRPWECPVTPY